MSLKSDSFERVKQRNHTTIIRMKFKLPKLLIVALLSNLISLVNSSLNATASADSGGNRGWGFSVAEVDQYASVQGYFPPGSFWPIHDITVSAWVRYTGIQQTGTVRGFPLSVTARGDSNHFQPFIILIEPRSIAAISCNVAGTAHNFVLPVKDYNMQYWAKFTLTYTTTGSVSHSNFYVNGTLLSNWTGAGKIMRWSDSSTLVVGGYASSSRSLSIKDRFLGWIDDLAFYNRVLPASEIAANWNKAGNVSDRSLFIYYDFNDLSTAPIIANRGVAGTSADLYNGMIFGGDLYPETISKQLRTSTVGYMVPGAPVQHRLTGPVLPIVVSLDVSTKLRIALTCSQSSVTPTAASVASMPAMGTLFQAPSNVTAPGLPVAVGAAITSSPSAVTNAASTVVYCASALKSYDSFTYTATCNGIVERGTVNVIVSAAAVADTTNSLTAVANTTIRVYLHGLHGIAGLLQAVVTTLPKEGFLTQLNMSDPRVRVRIYTVPTVVTNPLLGLRYVCPPVATNAKNSQFGFKVYHDNIGSAEAFVQITVQTWNYPPVVPGTSTHTVRDRSDLAINLSASDVNQKQFIGVYITSLPTKGKLYQRLADGSRGAVIDKLFSAYTRSVPTYQYGLKVINVSSTWGNSKDYSPSHALGPQDCNIYGDCAKAWCPQTADGDGGLANGTTEEGYKFRNNPDTDFSLFGYTEYLELQYNQSVYVSEMLIGENWGMGAVKNILAKDFLGNWMTLYTAIVDGTIEALFDKFAQYRFFRPTLCGTPFLTKNIRFEMDTRSVPGWNEWDFFRLGGSLDVDTSAVMWNGLATWSVIYVPDQTSSGMDSFTYAANNCPTNVQSWSSPGIVQINIVPTGFSGMVKVARNKNSKIDFSKWSINTADISRALNFSIATLPSVGLLAVGNVTVTTLPYVIQGSSKVIYVPDSSCKKQQTSFMYKSSDPAQTNPLEVVIQVDCPRKCGINDLAYTLSPCQEGKLRVTYVWNASTLSSEGCAPSDSFMLPPPFDGIPCGSVPFDSPSAQLVIFFSLFVGVVGMFFIVWLIMFRETAIVKLSQLGHSAVYCMGGIALQCSWMSYLGPVTAIRCMARPWLLGVSYSVMFGALIRKIFIVMKLLQSAENIGTKVQSQRLNQIYSVLSVLLVIMLDAVILIPWGIYSPSVPSGKSFKVPDIGDVTVGGYQCNSVLANSFTLILVGYKAALTAVGAVIAFRVRSLDSIVGESTMMLYSTYNLIVSGVLLLLISFIASIEPATYVIVASSISCLAVTFSLCILFLPKVFMQYKKITIVASELFNNATSRSQQSQARKLLEKNVKEMQVMMSGDRDADKETETERAKEREKSFDFPRRNSSSNQQVSVISLTKSKTSSQPSICPSTSSARQAYTYTLDKESKL